jgi:hypothetical protein
MPAYLLTWNPDGWPRTPAEIADRNRMITETAAGRAAEHRWNTGRIKQVKAGHRVFLVAMAPVNGVIAGGIVIRELGEGRRHDNPAKRVNLIQVLFDTYLDAPDAMPMTADQWRSFGVNPPLRQSGQRYVTDVAGFERRWKRHLKRIGFGVGEGRRAKEAASKQVVRKQAKPKKMPGKSTRGAST